jgi:hypothetical protein
MTALYAEPPQKPIIFEDCFFYHTVDVPGFGCTEGQWDLRQSVEAYLGDVPFRSTRVLEIGPASGYLTFEMERRSWQTRHGHAQGQKLLVVFASNQRVEGADLLWRCL